MNRNNEKLQDALVGGFFLALLLTSVAAFSGYTAVMAWGMSLMMCLILALGVARRGTIGPFKPCLIAALLVWLFGFSAVHLLPITIDELWLGLPKATAVGVYLLWPAPFFLVTLPYALLFDRQVLDEETLAELRSIAERRPS